MMARLPLYRAGPFVNIVIRPLVDITLIYHRPSGQTHLVVSPVPEIVSALGVDAASLPDIVAKLSLSYDLGDPDEACTVIAAHLDELADIGLIQRL